MKSSLPFSDCEYVQTGLGLCFSCGHIVKGMETFSGDAAFFFFFFFFFLPPFLKGG